MIDHDALPAKEYPRREIFLYGRYIPCQILNWDDGPPPKFLVCYPLDRHYRQEFFAIQAMGTWMHIDLCEALRIIRRDAEMTSSVAVER